MGGKRIELGSWSRTITEVHRGDTVYARGKFRHLNGEVKVYERSGATFTKAKAELRRLFNELAETNAAPAAKLGADSKLVDLIEEHLAWLEGQVRKDSASPGTVRTYRSALRGHLEPRIKGWRVSDATVQRLDALLDGLMHETSYETTRACRALLSAAMKLANRYGIRSDNPLQSVRPLRKPRKGEPRTLTREQAVGLVRALRRDEKSRKNDLPDLVLWMLTTSDRIGNALAASWSRIDLDTGQARLGRIVIRVTGEGLVVRDEDVSTKSRSRVVVLPKVTVEMLRRRRRAQTELTQWVFPHSGRGRKVGDTEPLGPRDPSNVARQLREALARVGYEWVTPHVFRKSVATGLRDSDVPVAFVSDYLGHANQLETEGTYLTPGASNPAIRAAIDDWWKDLADVADLDEHRAKRVTDG